MMVTFDLSTDFDDVVDNLEAITLGAPSEVDWDTMTVDEWDELTVDEWDALLVGDTTTAISSALRRALTTKEMAVSDGLYRNGDVVWHFAASAVSTAPVPSDLIIDSDSNQWTILEVSLQTLSNRYRCITRNLAISEELNTLVTIQKATFAKDADGAQEPTWADYRTSVRAKVQPQAAAQATENALRHTTREVIIYVLTEFNDIDESFRVVAADGKIYKVTGTASPERIDQLFEIHGMETPWPLA